MSLRVLHACGFEYIGVLCMVGTILSLEGLTEWDFLVVCTKLVVIKLCPIA